MKTLADLVIGDKVYFLEGYPDTFTVKAKKQNFIVATSNEVKTGVQYTIIDTDKGVCGPHDRTFNFYDFNDKEALDTLLNDLIEKKYGINLSRRHSASVSLLLNLPKTLNQ